MLVSLGLRSLSGVARVTMCNVISLIVQGTYYEAAVTNINVADQVLTASFPRHAGLEQFSFQIPYDIMVYSVGSKVNTFGIKVTSRSTTCDNLHSALAILWCLCIAQTSRS